MALNLHVPQQQDEFRPRICVVGVGGAGGNAINNMIASGLEGVEFLVCNTDAQDLSQSLCDNRLQLGPTTTKGLGAGMQPHVGAEAAQESLEEILHRLDGANMVFVAAGMGGGTGTGAAPVIAKALRERNVLTVGVVTKPFQFEGLKRSTLAEEGIANLSSAVDTLIVIPNQNLFRLANEKTTFADAFKMADNVLLDGVRGVSDLIVKPGIVNLDFADVRTLMTVMGKAMMGTGEGEGDSRALDAAERAIANPLLDDMSLDGARGVLINVTGGYDVTLYEVDAVANHVREKVDPEANIIFGSSIDEAMTGSLRVSVVATGIDAEQMAAQNQPQPGSPGPQGGPGTYPSGPPPGTPPIPPSGPPPYPSGPSGGPGRGGVAPQAANKANPPMSPFGRSPFAFRGGNRDQDPKSHMHPNIEAAAPSPDQGESFDARPVAPNDSPGVSPGVVVSPNYSAVPPASASMTMPTLTQASDVEASAGDASENDLFAPSAAPRQAAQEDPYRAESGGRHAVSFSATAFPAAPNQTAEEPLRTGRNSGLGGLFTRFAAPKQETLPSSGQTLFQGMRQPEPLSVPAQTANQTTPPSRSSGAAVAAANVGMQEMGLASPARTREPFATPTASVADLDVPLSGQNLDGSAAEFSPSHAGPRVVNIDDSANSGLESFDQSYKSVPAFLRHQNN